MNGIEENVFEVLQKILEPIKSLKFAEEIISDDIKAFLEEAKQNETLNRDDFEKEYSNEICICEELGRNGWVVSEYSNPRIIKEWYGLIVENKSSYITDFFEKDNQQVLLKIFAKLENKYIGGANKVYFTKARQYFDVEDYMTSSMYLSALIEERVSNEMDFPKKMPYREKYSEVGFEKHINNEFEQANSFMKKRSLFLDMYPSLIAFLNRLFVEGEYTFEKKIEPPYINRNWLLHGKTSRNINKYECVQLFNALSTAEFIYSFKH